MTPPANGTALTTLTLGTSAATPGGPQAFQVVGTSGALTRTGNMVVSVLVPNFRLSCLPASLAVVQGNSAVSTCRVTSTNTFSAPVSLSCAGLLGDTACAFDPAVVTPSPNGVAISSLTVSTSPATRGAPAPSRQWGWVAA